LLLAKGASLEVSYPVSWPPTPLFDVAMAGFPLDFNQAIDGGQMTPLVVSMYNHDTDMASFLLKNGASPNTPDKDGLTPLMHAALLVSMLG